MSALAHMPPATAWRPPAAPLGFAAMAATDPPPRDEVLPGLIAGSIGGIIATGGSRKSYYALQVAAAVAGGPDTLSIGVRRTGTVVLFALEDPRQIIHERSRALARSWSHDVVERVHEHLDIWPLVGAGANLLDPVFLDWMRRAVEGARLVVVDTMRRIHALDENDNGAMSALLSVLEQLCAKTGTTVIFLHHTSKGSEKGDAQASRGASALTDNARWILRLDNMKADEAEKLSDRPYDGRPIGADRAGFFVQMTHAKCNYGVAPQGPGEAGSPRMADQWYQAGDGGILAPVQLLKAKSKNGGGNGGVD